MSVGSSLPWREVLKIATSGKSSRLDVRPMLDYFEPLQKWLEIQNQNESIIGWTSTFAGHVGGIFPVFILHGVLK